MGGVLGRPSRCCHDRSNEWVDETALQFSLPIATAEDLGEAGSPAASGTNIVRPHSVLATVTSHTARDRSEIRAEVITTPNSRYSLVALAAPIVPRYLGTTLPQVPPIHFMENPGHRVILSPAAAVVCLGPGYTPKWGGPDLALDWHRSVSSVCARKLVTFSCPQVPERRLHRPVEFRKSIKGERNDAVEPHQDCHEQGRCDRGLTGVSHIAMMCRDTDATVRL